MTNVQLGALLLVSGVALGGCGGVDDFGGDDADGDENVEQASEAITHGIGSWNLFEDTITQAGKYTSNGDPLWFRWTSDNPHSTRVSVNWCDSSLIALVDIPAHDKNWHRLKRSSDGAIIATIKPGSCVLVRGRSLYGTQLNRSGIITL